MSANGLKMLMLATIGNEDTVLRTKFQYLWNRDIENFCMYIMERSGASVMVLSAGRQV